MKRLVFGIVIFAVFFWAIAGFCAQTKAARPKVVVTTSLIASIVEQVGKDRLDCITLIPPRMCPGHFDISPADLKALEQTKLFLKHGFEGEKLFDALYAKMKNIRLKDVTVDVKGNWMVPSVYTKAVDRIAFILSQAFPDDSKAFWENAEVYKSRVKSLADRIKETAYDEFLNVRVVASGLQKPFLEWCGFIVAAEYSRAENLTLEEYRNIIKLAEEEKVQLVVDNLQSGPNVGLPISYELNIPHVVLTNFPQGINNKFSYTASLESNVGKLINRLKR